MTRTEIETNEAEEAVTVTIARVRRLSLGRPVGYAEVTVYRNGDQYRTAIGPHQGFWVSAEDLYEQVRGWAAQGGEPADVVAQLVEAAHTAVAALAA